MVGESDSGWTPAFNVLYWPLRAFSRGMFNEVPALADGHVDVVPIDYVADGLVHLLGRREAGVFNLVSGRNAPQVDELVNLASDYFGKPHPKLVEPVAPEHVGDDQGDVFVPYFDMRVVFDDTRARARARPGGHRGAGAARLLRQAHGVRRGGALGQAAMTREAGAQARGDAGLSVAGRGPPPSDPVSDVRDAAYPEARPDGHPFGQAGLIASHTLTHGSQSWYG